LDQVEKYSERDHLVSQLKDAIPGTKTHNEWTNQLKEHSDTIQLMETAMSGPIGFTLAADDGAADTPAGDASGSDSGASDPVGKDDGNNTGLIVGILAGVAIVATFGMYFAKVGCFKPKTQTEGGSKDKDDLYHKILSEELNNA
jgi:hypothetical protein